MIRYKRRARVTRDIDMSEGMFDALMGFEVKHLRTPYASFTRDEVLDFLKETSTPEIVDAFKDYYLAPAPEEYSRS